MSKCLITKLRERVNDTSYKKMGVITVSKTVLEYTPDGRYVVVVATIPLTGRIISGNAFFTDGEGTANYGIEYTSNIFHVSDSCLIEFSPKYELTRLSNLFSKDNPLEIEDIKYCDKMYHLYYRYAKGELHDLPRSPFTTIQLEGVSHKGVVLGDVTRVYGDIAHLKDITTLETLVLNGSSVHGNIVSLGSLVNLGKLTLRGTKVTGTVEAFVKALRASGKTEGTMVADFPETVTINGVPCQYQDALTWSASSIRFNGKTVNI